MARSVVADSERIDFRIKADDKILITRAADLMGIGLTAFVRQHALQAAQDVVERMERITLSERDSQKLLDLLDNPPEPTAHLLDAARQLPKDS